MKRTPLTPSRPLPFTFSNRKGIYDSFSGQKLSTNYRGLVVVLFEGKRTIFRTKIDGNGEREWNAIRTLDTLESWPEG